MLAENVEVASHDAAAPTTFRIVKLPCANDVGSIAYLHSKDPTSYAPCKLAALERSERSAKTSRGTFGVLLGYVLELCTLPDSFTSVIGLAFCGGNRCRGCTVEAY